MKDFNQNFNVDFHFEFERLIQLHLDANEIQDKYELKLLLKELARRLILWKNEIELKKEKGELGSNILFDVSFEILNKSLSLPISSQLKFSYFDELLIAAYFNWKQNEEAIHKLGYELPNPYEPFIEIFKNGGKFIKFQYNRLEIYPFFGINIHPQ